MHPQEQPPRAVKPGFAVPATDDEIREKYLERAIRELNAFSREVLECRLCPRGNFTPVLAWQRYPFYVFCRSAGLRKSRRSRRGR